MYYMKKKTRKGLSFPILSIILTLSITLNMYFYSQLSITKDNLKQAEDDKTYIEELEKSKEDLTSKLKKSTYSVELENTAVVFLNLLYNTAGEDYEKLSTKAANVTNDDLYEFLFSTDPVESTTKYNLSDIEVFQNTNKKQVIVHYTLSSKNTENGHKYEEKNTVFLQFKKRKDKLVVSELEAINERDSL